MNRLSPGALNRFRTSLLDPSGGGVNVSRMARRLGWPTLALGFVAGETGLSLQRMLDSEGVGHHFVEVLGETRLNATIIEEDNGTETRLRGHGPIIDQEALARLDALLQFWLRAARVLVISGGLPPGAPDDRYVFCIRRAQKRGVIAILDAEEEWLSLGVAAHPYLIKPSVRQAEALLGYALPDLDAVVQAAVELARRGISVVVVSMGAQGAVGAEGGQVWRAWRAIPPRVEQQSTTGAGDSMVAGLAVSLARGESVAEGLRLGTAALGGRARGNPTLVAAKSGS